MKMFSLGTHRGAGFIPTTIPGSLSARTSGRALSVKASLRLAFAVLLIGTLAVGVIALTQISRLNGSTASIYN
jgi:methyl-accepting chemotaxis protein